MSFREEDARELRARAGEWAEERRGGEFPSLGPTRGSPSLPVNPLIFKQNAQGWRVRVKEEQRLKEDVSAGLKRFGKEEQ